MASKNLYNEDSIQSLSPLEFTRLRPGVYVGSTEYSTQLLVEIVSNAVDEYCAGHGDTIKVTIKKDNTVIVEDNGQGFIPNLMNKDGKSILETSFSVLNTSGKYTDEGVYEGVALGLNGIGSKLATYLSHWLEVISWRDGKYEHIWFKEGIFQKREVGRWNNSNNPCGTLVQWQPSEEFFTNVEIDLNVVIKLFKVLVCLCQGLTIIFEQEGKETLHFYSKAGLSDFVDENTKDNEILKNRLNINYENGKNKLNLVLTYTDNYSSSIVPYVNTGLTDSGPHITQFKTILTREMNKFFREKGWLKEKDSNLSGDDCQEGLYVVFNITTQGVSYDAQTKSRIVKLDMSPFNSVIADELRNWFATNEKELKIIADKALNARKAREAAKKARDAVREPQKKKDKVLKFDSKLADCSSKDRTKCEIYITEGDSASGNLKMARDNEFQAIMPIRGKILNVRKASLDKIQKNAEIMTMIEAFGLSVDKTTMKLTYKPEDLRYDKIIIESDADLDGSHIKNLFYTFIWTFCPQLIQDGHIYAGVPPLYKITLGKDKFIYIKDDAELEEWKSKHSGDKFSVKHLKGLGEMSESETEILVNPETRIIKRITVEDIKLADQLFDDLMGTDVTKRKEFINKYSKESVYSY